jgi:hypothetical protein
MTRPQTTAFQGAGTAAHPHRETPRERLSILRLSAGERLLGAACALALLWAAVYWALG